MAGLIGRCTQYLMGKTCQGGIPMSLVPKRMKSMVGCSDPRTKCKKMPKPPCGPPAFQLKKKRKGRKKKFVSMWQTFFCDENEGPCPVNPRFDQLYYEESDKAKRRYWQTWVSCPKLVIKPKKVCVNQSVEAPRQRRKPKKPVLSKAVCPSISKCPLIPNRCGRKARCPPSCPKEKSPSDCRKIEAPYPAFSECLRLKPRERPLSECVCWQKPMLCEVWAEFRKRNINKKI